MDVIQSGDKVIVNGEEIELEKGMGNSITVINERLFVDGKELVDGKWKRTARAAWHRFF